MNTFFVILAVYFSLSFLLTAIKAFMELLVDLSSGNPSEEPNAIDWVMAALLAIGHPIFMLIAFINMWRESREDEDYPIS